MTVGGLFLHGDSLRKRHLSRDLKVAEGAARTLQAEGAASVKPEPE